ncbi:MAG: hypothetical protein Q8S03_10300 [Brevundimonas sp.]|uniref:hypothetical protein n=1 Tax=Brevundimonas sp. TaxID=1871086 RepID=UPI002735D709|nr:hypothetical protein [Brevundimonas sp.]MDP3405070.1 hypothetical protein [Brevundimonas sp.]
MQPPTHSSHIDTSESDVGHERRSSRPIPADKCTDATLARPSDTPPAPFIYPPEWDGVVWMPVPEGRGPGAWLLECGGSLGLIIGAALIVATLLSTALGVAADAAVVVAGVAG